MCKLSLLTIVLAFQTCLVQSISVKLSVIEPNLVTGNTADIQVTLSDVFKNATTVSLRCEGPDCLDIVDCEVNTTCRIFTINQGSLQELTNLTVRSIGHVTLYLSELIADENEADELDLRNAFVELSVGRSKAILIFSNLVGWIYFLAWSISFYPQVITNYKRKSVVGLNFDFIGLNLTGFLFYSIFNICLYAVPSFQSAYSERYPYTRIPVELNDIFFALHAVFATVITIVQCIIYERGAQRMAHWATGFLVSVWVLAVILFGLVLGNCFSQLNYIYYFSYVKLLITIIKYIPQVWFNYRRKSTLGWSIGNILLDFTGGSLSILQMFLLAYNFDDWIAIFGNLTKFGLGAVSILFDVVFMAQHYVIYKDADLDLSATLTESNANDSGHDREGEQEEEIAAFATEQEEIEESQRLVDKDAHHRSPSPPSPNYKTF